MVKISIIIPVFNLEKYLGDTINSILNQTFKNFEVILINDGSKDNSGKICDFFKVRDDRVKVIHKMNEGSGSARNKGIETAQGEYIMFFDGDDLIEPNMLEKMYNEISKNRLDLVICNYNCFDTNIEKKYINNEFSDYSVHGNLECKKSYINLLKLGIIQSPWNKIYKSSIIKNNNIKFPNLRRSQDTVFNCMYFEHINSYKVISNPLYNYRVNNIDMAWIKFPKDYFDICKTVSDIYYKSFDRWNLLDNEVEQYLSECFISDVISCIICSFSPKWGLSSEDRKDYICSIVNDKKTRKAIEHSSQKTLFTKTIELLIRKKYVLMIMITTKISINIKYRLKLN